jgi:hypothetical protein
MLSLAPTVRVVSRPSPIREGEIENALEFLRGKSKFEGKDGELGGCLDAKLIQ